MKGKDKPVTTPVLIRPTIELRDAIEYIATQGKSIKTFNGYVLGLMEKAVEEYKANNNLEKIPQTPMRKAKVKTARNNG